MTFRLKTTLAAHGAVLLLAVFLTACAGTAPRTETLAERAQARWDALLAADFDAAYGYLSPGTRSAISLDDYSLGFRLRKVAYDSATYLDQQCEMDACTVRMSMAYTLIAPLRGVQTWKGKAVIDEKWVRVDQQWWHLPAQ